MSWSFGVGKTPVAEFDAAIDAAAQDYKQALAESDWQPTAEATAAVEQAVAAAKAIVASGVVGSGTVTANLSGHANPGHAPASGYANDCVTVSVNCADTYVAPAPAAVEETFAVSAEETAAQPQEPAAPQQVPAPA